MSDQSVLYAKQYTRSVLADLQQHGSRFREHVSFKGDCHGELSQWDTKVGTLEAQEITTKGEPVEYQEPSHDARWFAKRTFDVGFDIHPDDEISTVVDMSQPYIGAARDGMGRKIDDIIIAAHQGTAKTGKDGGTNTSFTAGQIIAVDAGAAAANGLSFEKLIALQELYNTNEVDVDMEGGINIAIGPKQDSNLLREVQLYSEKYKYPATYDAKGRVKTWMMFNFIRSNRLTVNGSSHREALAWVKSGLGLGFWTKDWYSDLDRAKWIKGHPKVGYLYGAFNATRRDELKCGIILCAE